jgi:hypothetical protein
MIFGLQASSTVAGQLIAKFGRRKACLVAGGTLFRASNAGQQSPARGAQRRHAKDDRSEMSGLRRLAAHT